MFRPGLKPRQPTKILQKNIEGTISHEHSINRNKWPPKKIPKLIVISLGIYLLSKSFWVAAGLLARGSSYSPRLPMPFRPWAYGTVASSGFRPHTQRRVRAGITPASLLRPSYGLRPPIRLDDLFSTPFDSLSNEKFHFQNQGILPHSIRIMEIWKRRLHPISPMAESMDTSPHQEILP